MHVSKRVLGVSHLVGTGLALSLALAGRILLRGFSDPVTAVATLSGLCLSVLLVAIGSWLLYSDFDGDEVWIVARYGGLGLSLVTLPIVLSIVLPDPNDRLVIPLVSNVAAGGLVGVAGGVIGMRAHGDRSDGGRILAWQGAGSRSGFPAVGTDRPRTDTRVPGRVGGGRSPTEVRSLLDHPRRRAALRALVSVYIPVAVTDLALHVAREEDDVDREVTPPATCHEVYESLRHEHLPRLADADLVVYDAERGYVEPTERIERAVPYLDLDARRVSEPPEV